MSRHEWAVAAERFRVCLRLQPERGEFHVGLGTALLRFGSTEEALAAFQTALAINPHDIAAGQFLVCALELLGRREESVGAWCNLAASYATADRFREAIAAYRQAVSRKPDCLKALVKIGQAQLELGEPHEAKRAYEAALAIDPEHAWAHNGVGWASLSLGNFRAGWAGFAVRQRRVEREVRDFEQPVWEGSSLAGKTILIWVEQGLGDTIQFLRYVRLVKDAGARVVIDCYRTLLPIVRRLNCVDQVIATGAPLPPFDVHIPFASLPLACQRLTPSIPRDVPYLAPDPALVEAWSRRCPRSRGVLTVGLVWSGALSRAVARIRHAPLAAFQPLSRVGGVRFVSLQLGPRLDELLAPPAGLQVEPVLNESCSLDDTAALLQSVDLVISVDTMIVHLAGALARPVWTLLAVGCDWRWQYAGDECPWYPTMRLFRQTRARDWREVLGRVATALAAYVARGRDAMPSESIGRAVSQS
jgi:Flp pilus assembly protein TadD